MKRRILAAFVVAIVACNEPTPPTPPADPGTLIHFTAVSVGDVHACALDDQQRAWCWGTNLSGALGLPTLCGVECGGEARLVPTALRFTSISAGSDYTCGLQANGAAYCWGRDNLDQLGAATRPPQCGSFICSSTPLPVSGGFTFKQIGAGRFTTCGVTTNDVGKCWGSATFQLLGTGTAATQAATPQSILVSPGGDSVWSSIAGGGFVSKCGVIAGQVACWGLNFAGALGIGSTTNTVFGPTPVNSATPLHGVVVGLESACALDAAGLAYCWGLSDQGSLGLGPGATSCAGTGPECAASPTRVLGGLSFTTLAAGYEHVCGLVAGGAMYCWGNNFSGQVGSGRPFVTPTTLITTTPTPVTGGLHFAAVSAGGSATCAITTDAQLWCWGSNYSGQIGMKPVETDAYVPIRVIPVVTP